MQGEERRIDSLLLPRWIALGIFWEYYEDASLVSDSAKWYSAGPLRISVDLARFQRNLAV
jgi:hypothetical protein